jgi:hypothetical protein
MVGKQKCSFQARHQGRYIQHQGYKHNGWSRLQESLIVSHTVLFRRIEGTAKDLYKKLFRDEYVRLWSVRRASPRC